MKRIDEWGRVIVDGEEIEELLYAGASFTDLLVENVDLTDFNARCRERDLEKFILSPVPTPDNTPEEENARRINEWVIGHELEEVDIREFLISMCETNIQKDRVNLEMDAFEERNLLPLLRAMIVVVDHFRRNEVVWGVGRGSSVASYVLFLIGVHKIDSIKYAIPITEFLK